MSDSIIKLFNNSEIRFVDHPEGKFEFGIVADDMAKVLEAHSGKDIARSVDDDWKGAHNMPTLGGTQSMTVIWEAGIYQLLAVSRKPKAKLFQKWLFGEVLPSIRKTGKYEVNQNRGASKALMASREINEIHDNVEHISPRIAQFLIDCCINEVIEGKSLVGSNESMYRGVAEIAKEMDLPVTEKNRGSLGKFVKSELAHLVKYEKRLCNGTMQDVAAYPDTEEVRERISLFFSR